MRRLRTASTAIVVTAALFAAACNPGNPVVSSAPVMPAIGPLLDRVGRPLVSTAMAAPFAPSDAHAAAAAVWKTGSEAERLTMLLENLAVFDGLDGACGNQLAAGGAGPDRYRPLATLLLDDRLLIDTRATSCKVLLSVETGVAGECGGLSPAIDEPDALLSYLVSGAAVGVTDGVDGDADGAPSVSAFPFLLAPSL